MRPAFEFPGACRAAVSFRFLRALIGVLAVCAAAQAMRAEEGVEGVTAVASKVSGDYVRAKLPNGSFQVENYAYGNGGRWPGEISDGTIDKLQFIDVARVIAKPLAGRNYIPARDPAETRLLIMLYWGTTAVPEPPSSSAIYNQFKMAQDHLSLYTTTSVSGRQVIGGGPLADAALSQMSAATIMLNMENRQRDRTDFANAQMLGYDSPGLIGTEQGNYARGTAFGVDRDDLYADIEENRYFVVLMAYDFQLLWKQKRHKLLWETRFSINQRRNDFTRALPVIADYASSYFGRDSHGLQRTRVPEGHVEIGNLESLGAVPLK